MKIVKIKKFNFFDKSITNQLSINYQSITNQLPINYQSITNQLPINYQSFCLPKKHSIFDSDNDFLKLSIPFSLM